MTFHSDIDAGLARKLPLEISGRGGGKGSSASNDPNTLRSRANMRLIEIISEGPIVGLVDGLKSIYLDQTPIKATDNSENFEKVYMEEHKGLPDDTSFVGFAAVENTVSVETQVKNSNQNGVVRTIADPDVNAINVIIRIPALVRNDPEEGLKKTSVEYAIDYRSMGGPWLQSVRYAERNQKTVSAFQRQFRVDLPEGGAPWDVRVRRMTSDSDDDMLQNDTWWDSYVTLTEGKFTYPHTAAVALRVNAEDMGSSMPSRIYHIKGLIISVPSNYDPVTRIYTGVWNGTFKQAWTNNPAWIFYDLILNDRYGLGEFISADMVDKWSLYTIAQYCDQLVPSGFKNPASEDIMEPRFSYNGVIKSREEAFFVLQQITRAWRGMAFWAIGQVFATADMPSDPVKLVTPANVIDGAFDYSSTAIKARHSVIMVTWNNPDNFFESEIEPVIDTKLLHKYNWREKQVTLDGCTSRGLAHRYGKWIIDSEQNETETISYQASWDHADLRPGHIIAVSDPRKAQIRAGGRIVDHNANVVQLDAPFEANDGHLYWLILTLPSGKLEKQAISHWLDDSTCVVAAPFSEVATPNAMFTVTGTDIVPRNYRVLSIEEEETNVFRVTGLFHDPLKFDRIERDIVFEALPYSRPDGKTKPPKNVYVRESGYVSNGTSFHTLTCSWSPPEDQLIRGYFITATTPDNTTATLGFTEKNFIDLNNATAGLYVFSVQSVNFAGVMSKAATAEYEAMGPEGFARPTVEHVQLVDNPSSTEFKTRDIRFRWKNKFNTSINAISTETDAYSPFYKNNKIKIYRASDNVLLREILIVGNEYTYTFEANKGDNGILGPQRNIRVDVTVQDTIGRESAPLSVTFVNPPPAAIAPVVFVNGKEVYLHYPTEVDSDFAGVMVWAETTSGYNPALTEPTYDGSNNPITVPLDYDTGYYCRIAAYDIFGRDGLNYSSEFAVTTMTDGVDIEAPDTPTGLKIVSAVVNNKVTLTATWNAVSATDLAAYDLQVKQDAGNWVSFQCFEPVWQSEATPGVVYQFQVRARDKSSNSSPYSIAVSHTAARDLVAPALPTNFTVSAGITSLWLSWTNPADIDLLHVEIWEGLTAVLDDAVMISISRDTSAPRTALGSNQTRYYWLRAVDTSDNKSDYTPVKSGTTSEMPVQTSLSPVGLLFTTAPTVNKASWAAFTMHYNVNAVSSTKAIAEGSITHTTQTIYVYYVPGETSLRSTTNVSLIYSSGGLPVAVYRGGSDIALANGQVVIDGASILAGSIGADQLTTNNVVITQTAQIKDAIIDDAKILNIDAGKLKANTVISNTIVVGDGGDTLDQMVNKIANPAEQINTATTLIEPGKIKISGSTTLSSLLYGGDNTKIDGGKLAANTIKANSVDIGMRGIDILGLTFEHNKPANNQISWSGGTIGYVDNAGVAKSANIAAGSATWTVQTLYVYWNINAAVLASTTNFTTANADDRVILASYRGGKYINANYGRTVIEGGEIKSQTIVADQIATDAIEARMVKTDAIESRHVKALSIDTNKLAANSVNAEKIAARSINAEHIVAERIDAKVLVQDGTLITDLIAAYAVSDLTVLTGTGSISAVFKSITGGRRVINFGCTAFSADGGTGASLYRNGSLISSARGVTTSEYWERGSDGQSSGYNYNSVMMGVFVDTGGSLTDTYEVRTSRQSASTYLQITSFKR